MKKKSPKNGLWRQSLNNFKGKLGTFIDLWQEYGII